MKDGSKMYLILGSHAHVPSGAKESDFEYAYNYKMRPFISNLYRYTNIQAVLHYSGVLLYWVERNHPEFFMLIEDMVTRKQAEIIGGGFYEPMFPVISNQDRIGQIEFLTTYVRKHFGKRPLGCWIPYMAWEQNMAASLSASDMLYTFLSQDQFLMAGITGNDLFSPCITEDQGKIIIVFPVCKSIEEKLAENSFSKVFSELKNQLIFNENKSYITVFPDDILLDNQEAVDTAWNRFFEEISLSNNIIETILPSKIIKSGNIYKKASFPNSTSIKNYSPRNYLIEHSEINGIYSKMNFINLLISQLKGDRSRKQNAREELWKAQDSSLYVPDRKQYNHLLRKTAYSSLLKAEHLSREKNKYVSSLIQYDFDFDGNKEFLIQDAPVNCYIQLIGASLFELDYLPKEWNYLDCGKDNPDEYGKLNTRRCSFRDMLMPYDTDINNINNLRCENARKCFNEKYDIFSQDRKGKLCFKLPNISGINDDVSYKNIEIVKCYSIKKDVLTVSYQLKNNNKENEQQAESLFCFLSEINLSFVQDGEEFVRFYYLNNEKEIHINSNKEETFGHANVLKVLDVANEVQILLGSSSEFNGRLQSITKEGQYEATRIFLLFNISLKSGKSWNNDISLKFSH